MDVVTDLLDGRLSHEQLGLADARRHGRGDVVLRRLSSQADMRIQG